MRTPKEYKDYYASPEFQEAYLYEGNDLGAVCSEEGSSFLLWSPDAEHVTLRLYRDGEASPCFRELPMQKREKGVWEYRTEENLHGTYYDFSLEREGVRVSLADPCAKACGANGRRSMAVELARTDPEGWASDRAPAPAAEQFIYELHVKEFSWDPSGGFPEEYRGKFKAFTCADTTLYGDGKHPTGLAYLKDLGVTHIQIMPAFDYGSVDEEGDPAEFNWGYDPVNYNVPEGSYATDARDGAVRIREMKEMVQSLHRQGFRVIMDVVYNHTYSLDSWLQRSAPWYYYRVHEDGSVSEGSACGNDMASERSMCAAYILNSVLYWTEEYHIDGFRFDLMGLLDVGLMNRIQHELDRRYGKGEKLIFGEPWAASDTAMEGGAVQALKENVHLLDGNVGFFCDNTRDAVKGHVFDLEEPGFVNGGSGWEQDILNAVRAWCGTAEKEGARDGAQSGGCAGKAEIKAGKMPGIPVSAPAQVITYISAHDNLTLWDKLVLTMEPEAGFHAMKEELLRAYRLAAGIYLTCQGRIFFLSGEEFARTKEGIEDSYSDSIEINRLDWKRAWENRELVEYYRGLIALRRQLPGLCDKTCHAAGRIQKTWTQQGVAGYFMDNRGSSPYPEKSWRWDTLCVCYNSTKKAVDVVLPEGAWEILADGRDSFAWKAPREVRGRAQAEPVSVLILGRRQG